MNSKERIRRAKVILSAAEYRLRFASDLELFSPLEHIEHELNGKRGIRVAFRTEIWDDGVLVPARVKFYKSTGSMLVEISERTAREAACGLPQARFALAHEIGHINLHKRPMQAKIDGAERHFSSGEKKMHPETKAMEDEAHLYGSVLLVPLSRVHKDAEPLDLANIFNAPPLYTQSLRWKVMEVWSTIKKIEREKGSK